MIYIDRLFINQLSSRLRNFKWVGNHANFSCPECGDSKKKTSKARAWFYNSNSGFNFTCYNCNASISFYGLFKKLDETLFKEYLIQKKLSNLPSSIEQPKEPDIIIKQPKEYADILSDILCVLELDDNSKPVNYLTNRKIPKDKWNKIYYTNTFMEWCNSVKPNTYSEYSLKYEHSRLVFPFFDENMIPYGFSARSLSEENSPKYIIIKLDDTKDKIFGMDSVDFTKRVYVTEGQIDSLFLPNAIAASGAAFNSKLILQNINNCVIIYDNEPRSKEIMNSLEKTITNGYSVFIWPENIKEKDINDLSVSGYTTNEILDMIDSNIYSGMNAVLKYKQWRKVK